MINQPTNRETTQKSAFEGNQQVDHLKVQACFF